MKKFLTLTIWVLTASSAFAHGGGLDGQGGHHNRKAGGYHFHRGPLKGQSFSTKKAAADALAKFGAATSTGTPEARTARASKMGVPTEVDADNWQDAEAYSVSRVIDGDTVELKTASGLVKVRLIGVDTPETVHPQKPVEYYGREASLFLKNLLRGESVHVVYGQERVDQYGRTLAYLYRVPDGLFVNLEIIRQGYGHAYLRFPFRHMDLFNSYQQRARQAGKGLWGEVHHR